MCHLLPAMRAPLSCEEEHQKGVGKKELRDGVQAV